MRTEKQLLLDEIKEKITKSNGFLVTSYKEFTASQSRAFRDHVVEAGGEFEVVKKRVFIQAARVSGYAFEVGALRGHVGVVFSYNDPLRLAKQTNKYSEENNKAIAFLGGVIEGASYSGEEVDVLAKLPTLSELRAQVVGLCAAPLAQTLSVMQAFVEKNPA